MLVLALHGRAAVRCQSPFAALEYSEPEPDFSVVPAGDDDTDHPSEAHLIIEVAESSLAMDRGKKLRLYANCVRARPIDSPRCVPGRVVRGRRRAEVNARGD